MALAVTSVVPLSEYCYGAPSVASTGDDLLFVAWQGKGNQTFNIIISSDGGQSFRHKWEFKDQKTIAAPAIAVFNGTLFIAWTGTDHQHSLNIAPVTTGKDENGETTVTGLDPSNHQVLSQSSDNAPALVAFDGQLFLAWKGNGNNGINIMSSSDGFATIDNHNTPEADNFADYPLSLAVFNNNLWIAWKGTSPTPYIQFAQVQASSLNLTDQQPLPLPGEPVGQVTNFGPILASNNPNGPGILFTAFLASLNGNSWLSLSASTGDGNWLFPNYSGYSMANSPGVTWFKGKLFIAWPASGTLQIMTGRNNFVPLS